MKSNTPANIDEYISRFPENVQNILQQLRLHIKKVAPESEESISYGIPAFNLRGRYLVYFAAFKNHIGMYPAPVEEESFKKDFLIYKTGKGSVQFPFSKPIPIPLITRIVKFRMKKCSENGKKAASKISRS